MQGHSLGVLYALACECACALAMLPRVKCGKIQFFLQN